MKPTARFVMILLIACAAAAAAGGSTNWGYDGKREVLYWLHRNVLWPNGWTIGQSGWDWCMGAMDSLPWLTAPAGFLVGAWLAGRLTRGVRLERAFDFSHIPRRQRFWARGTAAAFVLMLLLMAVSTHWYAAMGFDYAAVGVIKRTLVVAFGPLRPGSVVWYEYGLSRYEDQFEAPWFFDAEFRMENGPGGRYPAGGLAVALWFPTLLLGVAAWRLYPRMLRAALRSHCRTCGYDLTGNQSGVCPECGTAWMPRTAKAGSSSENPG